MKTKNIIERDKEFNDKFKHNEDSKGCQVEAVVSHNSMSYWLPRGFVIKIKGIPFVLQRKTKIQGHKRNFIIADLIMDDKNCG